MSLEIVTAPLLSLPAEAVVHCADSDLRYTPGPKGEIFEAAGKLFLQRALTAIGSCGVGEAVTTEGFGLSAKYIIHTVPPRWCGGKYGEDALLAQCYRNVLKQAELLGVRSVAIPDLSKDKCGYPVQRAISVAKKELLTYPYRQEMTVFLSLPSAG